MKNTKLISLAVLATLTLVTACGGEDPGTPDNPNDNNNVVKTTPPGMLPMQQSDLPEAFQGTIDSLAGFVPEAPEESAYVVGKYTCSVDAALRDQRGNKVGDLDLPSYNPEMAVAIYKHVETGRYALHMQGGPSIFNHPIFFDELGSGYSWREGENRGKIGFVEESKRGTKPDKHELLVFDRIDESDPSNVLTIYRWYTVECTPQ